MRNYIKNEFKRAFFSKGALICFGISLIIFLLGFSELARFGIYGFTNVYDFIDIFLYCRDVGKFSILVLIAPLLAAIVYSNSYLSDKNSGYLKFIYLRIDKKKYILTRLIANAVVSGLMIVLASLVMLIILAIIYGINIKGASPSLNIEGPLSYVYYNNKWLYCIIILMLSFSFYAIFSTLALGASTIINNKYFSFLAPFFYYIISGTLFIIFKLYPLNATCLFKLKAFSIQWIISYQIILLTIGSLLFYFGVLYRNEKDL
ncbi:hypothetical protein AAGC94_12035 [Clostridium sporogenes]|uniref:hypothetical protein n=1 Tax=Clostridium sporogenes TaxID=1509 RepID=UPI00313F0637